VAQRAPERGSRDRERRGALTAEARADSWVDGRALAGSGGTRAAIDPATGQPFAEVSLLVWTEAERALVAARRAQPAWAALSLAQRGRHLLRLRDAVLSQADALAALIAREQGKPVAEAHLVEIFPSLESLKHLAEHAEVLDEEEVPGQVLLLAHKRTVLRYEPYGVVLVITPWNYPFSISLTGVAAALQAGNAVVLKPAPATTLIGLTLGELAQKAGLPPGLVNVVATDDAVAQRLVEDPRVDKIVFTGSVATGKRVMASAAKNLTPVVLELGGKDPAIVLRDADLDRTAAGLVWGGFVNAGQTCASVERVYVEEPVATALVDKVVALTRALKLGNPSEPETDMGPLTIERQRQVVEQHVTDALARGAKALTGGARPEGAGCFYPPTVLTNVDHSMQVMREETFGPVLPIMVVKDAEEAIRLANDSDYGLTASVWTQDEEKARDVAGRLQAGVVTINDCVYSYGEPSAPWGGYKRSGIGRTHGAAGLREMARVKYVAEEMNHGPAIWWFPYGDEFRRMMAATNRALHGGLFARLRDGLRLLSFRRFWRRGRLLDYLRNIDKAL
jgi:succinate-semialdehyde dehydrogenase/glutarate-semialdehyde dehydrogenase